MNLKETLDEVFEYYEENLNEYLEEQGLKGFDTFLKSAEKLDVKEFSIAIFPTMMSGSMLSFGEENAELTISILWTTEKKMKEESLQTCVDYWIALTDFARKSPSFGIATNVLESAAFRMDEGYERNGGGILLEIQIQYLMDRDNYFSWG